MHKQPTSLSRRRFLKYTGWGAACAASLTDRSVCVAAASSENRPPKPNILMIMVDDLGYGDLSSYGAKDLYTPHIDALVENGMRFDRFYANCPVCSPTRASLLTGRYPDMAGVPGVIRTHEANSWGHLSESLPLLPKVLKQGGYHTACIGKWHLGLASPNTPNERGFDFFHGFLGDMMDDYWNHRRHGINYMYRNQKLIDPEGHATDLFTRWSAEYIRSRKNREAPFFLYLAYNAPHTPIQPPPEWVKKVKEREKGISDKRAKLVAFIEHLDDGIGEVTAALKETGQWDNTLVIFTSDNGGLIPAGADNGPLHGGKQEMWEGGIREPFCAVWPGKIKAGSRDTVHTALTMDLYPTICEAAGVSFNHQIDGRSFLPLLLGAELVWPERTLFWVRREGGRYQGRAYYAARLGRWKLLQNTPFEPLALYDLEKDPKETTPLAENHPMYRRLFRALQDHINRAGAVPWKKGPVAIERIYKGPAAGE